MNKKPSTPQPPYHWVFNDTAAGVRWMGEDSQVRYQMGPAIDSDRSCPRAIYVHADDLDKFQNWLRNTGQLAEVTFCQEVIDGLK